MFITDHLDSNNKKYIIHLYLMHMRALQSYLFVITMFFCKYNRKMLYRLAITDHCVATTKVQNHCMCFIQLMN